ncbi:hypothetical protein PH214_16010 (plasmid) [Nitratidesulfovibrio vulgaris]|jgi:hypothetical protein|nr:hypothetical protein [Nitratidesulfovibrio vulgaris]WCB48147.1 hypothetical protein PH214_16010 [Nitratidesulfovibrio vulgaris]
MSVVFDQKFRDWLESINMAGAFPALERVQELLLLAPQECKQTCTPEENGIKMFWFYYGLYQGRLIHEQIESEPPEIAHLVTLLED